MKIKRTKYSSGSTWSPRFRRTVTTVVAAIVGGLGVVGAMAPAAAATGSVLTNETFTGSTVADARWIGLGAACLTGATGAAPATGSNLGGCEHTDQSPTIGATPGYLQLTDNSANQTGSALYDRALPSSGGLDVTFTSYQYAAPGTTGIGAADGIGFYLTDGSYSLAAPGPYGGSLGYAPNAFSSATGLPHGYLGVGLDVFGFYGDTDIVGGSGCTGPTAGYSPQAIAVRDAGDGTGGYCLGDVVGMNSLHPGATLDAADLASSARTVRVVVSPVTAADPYPTVTTYIDFTGSGSTFEQVSSYTMTTPAPATYRFGFSASTGDGTEVHLIRLNEVASVTPLGAVSIVKTVDHSTETGTTRTTFTVGQDVPFSLLVTNTGAEALTDVSVTDPLVDDVVCPAVTIAPADSMTCTGSHRVTAAEAAAGTFTNVATVDATDSDGVSHTASSEVAVPTFLNAVSLVKSADASGLHDPTVVGDTITYSFTVTNTGNAPLTGVAITDALPGLSALTYTWPGAAGELAPSQSATATASYQVTAADITAGKVENSATATGTGSDGTTATSDPATTHTALKAAAAPSNGSLAMTGASPMWALVIAALAAIAMGGVAMSAPRKLAKVVGSASDE